MEITGAGGRTVTVQAVVDDPASLRPRGFVEAGGHVSMDADGFTRATRTGDARWTRVPGLGLTDAGGHAPDGPPLTPAHDHRHGGGSPSAVPVPSEVSGPHPGPRG